MAVCVGDVGRAVTVLAPSGKIEIDGARLDARSDGSVIEAGSMVVVLRGDPTGYVVRKHTPGSRPVPNHGQTIPRGEFQQTRAEVAAAENNEYLARLAEVRTRMRRGVLWSVLLGAVAGVASAAMGLHFDWADESVTPATLYGASVGAGVVWAVVLYFLTGWFVAHILPSDADAVFEPNFVAVAVGLVGAALGFWVTFGGDAMTIAAQTSGISLAFAALAAALSWLFL